MEKALIKTIKSAFDLQTDNADKSAKINKGISFAIVHGNSIEYVHIPTLPEQKHKYFFNPSHLTAEERKRILEGKILLPRPIIEDEEDL